MLIYILVPVVLIVVYVVATYNKFVTIKTQIVASLQEIGNQLKRQFDLIPNLEASAKGYLKHEKGIFKDLTAARKAVESAVKNGGSKAIETAQDKLSAVLPRLQVVVESNPEIKGAGVVTKLMDELRDTSDKVMYSRRTLIDLTQDFNQMVVVFPTNLVASMFGMKKQKGLSTPMSGAHIEVSEKETKSPKVSL